MISAFVSLKGKAELQEKKNPQRVGEIKERGEQVYFFLSHVGFIVSSMFNSAYLINIA